MRRFNNFPDFRFQGMNGTDYGQKNKAYISNIFYDGAWVLTGVYDYHDYDADMSFGMAISLYGQLETGNSSLAYRRRVEGSLGALAMFLRCITLG